ncbi:hypothetical protein LL999_22925 [Burkholderia ambifaria]|uniref:hypothetical protein n=1 Tax=Burkholderia ambifaria TaxID=152480 RepID=UPI001E2BE343|nr:hypothetical protein [Burkholderia ambifaria]UEP23101.1 hypothetical protein LL999_22925 [Burkholderia ambifaria]
MASLADQFAADAGTASGKGASLSAQFAADASAAPAPVAAPAPTQHASMLEQLGHQLGLTARAGATGITALPAMMGDALNSGVNLGIRGINAVADSHIPELQMPSQLVQRGMNAVGLPQPQNPTERIVQSATAGMASVPTSMGMGGVLAKSASPVAAAVGNGLRTAPGMQMFGAAGAGAGSQGAAELGLNPWWQLAGGVLGGAAGVAAGSGMTAAARGIGNAVDRATRAPMTAPAAAARADIGVDRAIAELGPQAAQSFSPSEIAPAPPVANPALPSRANLHTFGTRQGSPVSNLKEQVAQQIQQYPDVDPAAALRSVDFRNLGIQPTLGQITRDPMQFAQEMNMRGVPEVGAPLTQRFNAQNTQLQQNLYGLAGRPSDTFAAGSQLQQTLRSIDDQMAGQVRSAYEAARASSGKNLDVPLQGLAQDYAQVLNDFGDKVPSGVRNNFNQLGLMSGTQQKTFSIENAENLLKVINANQSNDPATNAALGRLRSSVKSAILNADDKGGVYAGARQLAAQRFALHEQVPALEAASSESVAPDDFVRRFVTNGKTNDVLSLANLLREQNRPSTLQEMRSQIGGQLAKAGFGANPAGDAKFGPAAYANALRNMGDTKLSAFYTPDEIAQLHTIGRVGGYINSHPAAAPVNTSNTASAIFGLMGKGVEAVPYVGKLIQGAHNRAFVQRALAASLANASTPTPSYPAPSNALAAALLRSQATNGGNGAP